MKPGDLVQVINHLQEFGKIGIVVGILDAKWNLNPRITVMLPDGVREFHFANLKVINETR